MDIVEKGAQKKSHLIGGSRWLAWAVILALVFTTFMYLTVQLKYRNAIFSIDEVPAGYSTALVFGAGLKAKGEPGAVLEDRILTALELYQAGKVRTVQMSGDNSTANHNEVQAMQNLAISEGLPGGSIVLDHAGMSTLESCLRAREEFGLEKVVLVTQKYHLKRALYVCNKLGLDAVGVDAARQKYSRQSWYSVREVAASALDWVQVARSNILKIVKVQDQTEETGDNVEQ